MPSASIARTTESAERVSTLVGRPRAAIADDDPLCRPPHPEAERIYAVGISADAIHQIVAGPQAGRPVRVRSRHLRTRSADRSAEDVLFLSTLNLRLTSCVVECEFLVMQEVVRKAICSISGNSTHP